MTKLENSTARPVQLYSPINNSAPPRRRGLSQLSDLVLDLLHAADTEAGVRAWDGEGEGRAHDELTRLTAGLK